MLNWYRTVFPEDTEMPSLVSGDASFRKFFRTSRGILMDAPPETEKNHRFVKISGLYNEAGVHAPAVLAVDYDQGYLLVEDLGNQTMASVRSDENLTELYLDAVNLLGKIAQVEVSTLQAYDPEFVEWEDHLGLTWYLEKACHADLSEADRAVLCEADQLFVENAFAQPQIAMHRDYHSRNIMVQNGQLGIVDFQDTIAGPLTYDLASLLFDCYFKLPPDLVQTCLWVAYEMYDDLGLLRGTSYQEFERWTCLCGLQRHYKCLGIFARLARACDKPGYLNDIPLVLTYMERTTRRFPELQAFGALIRRCTEQAQKGENS